MTGSRLFFWQEGPVKRVNVVDRTSAIVYFHAPVSIGRCRGLRTTPSDLYVPPRTEQLYVGNLTRLPKARLRVEVHRIFVEFGDIVEIFEGRGFAIVTFVHSITTTKVLEANRCLQLEGNTLNVQRSAERNEELYVLVGSLPNLRKDDKKQRLLDLFVSFRNVVTVTVKHGIATIGFATRGSVQAILDHGEAWKIDDCILRVSRERAKLQRERA